MKIYKIPENLETILFDIDSTLYTNSEYAFEQVDIQIRHFASLRSISNKVARSLITNYRKEWSKKHEGKKISLGNTLTAFNIPIETSIKWRKELLEPKLFLSRDTQLIETLLMLKKKFKLICVTNNPVLPARKTLKAIGIDKIIPQIIGLDTCNLSKPAKEPFLKAVRETQSQIENCLSIGDRYDLDLALPLELGMGAIEVSGVADVYNLPHMLCSNRI